MHILAVVPVEESGERLETALARILGRSAYDFRSRVRQADGPVVVASFADPTQGADAEERLAAYGFETYLVGSAEAESDARRFLVRRFELQPTEIVAETANGTRRALPYDAVELVLRGTASTLTIETETVKHRRFSASRALLSGGLLTSKTTTTRHDVRHEEREGFLHIYAGGQVPLALREGGLQYQGLGAQLRPTRALNFLLTVNDELQRRCPEATYDERLLVRAHQAHILGSRLSPTVHLDLAISLWVRYLTRRARSDGKPAQIV